MGNLYLGDRRIETNSMYLGDAPLFDDPIFIGDDGTKYYEKDCHIFIANGNEVKLPIPANDTDPCPAVFVAVDGEEVTPTREEVVIDPGEPWESTTYHWSIPANENQIIHAIFDWYNRNDEEQDWFSDILQFGYNSETGERNQLKNGKNAFYGMEANPAALSTLDVSNLKYMNGMFKESSFNQDISNWDTSNVTDMRFMFVESSFNQDISGWDTSKVEYMSVMFYDASFNQDISGWDTSKVTDMSQMFKGATDFNQDLSQWCVSQFDTKPLYFDDNSGFTGQTAKQPNWGTCPRGENIPNIDDILPDPYETADCHIFIANGNTVNLPIPSGTLPTFVSVNGVDVTPTSFVTRTVEREEIAEDGEITTTSEEVEVVAITASDGDIIHAIFNWKNMNAKHQNWFHDILQFGLNSATGKRNQLVTGNMAFYKMNANPEKITDLDVSNLKTGQRMFYYATQFNQPVGDWDVSNCTDMLSFFENANEFDQDLSNWNVSKVKNMSSMFRSTKFNNDIAAWNTSSVENMASMFRDCTNFNQDLSQWCVTSVTNHLDFDQGANSWTKPKPNWGTCPRGEDLNIEFPGDYTLADCHIFVANGNEVNIPIPSGTLPTFVAINGVDATPTSFVTRTVEVPEIGVDGVTTTTSQDVEVAAISANNGDLIHAIFDWDNENAVDQNWFSDILQFGLNSITGKRNQLKNGRLSFYIMTANPAAIATLDVSNVTDMIQMFCWTPSFNQDISQWDTSNVTSMLAVFLFAENFNSDISQWNTSKVEDMYGMFSGAAAFNQDLSQWCVSLIGTKPDAFDSSSGFEDQSEKQPQWGNCPRGEDGKPIITLPDIPEEPEAPEISPPSEYTIIKAYDNGDVSLVYAPYEGDFRYSWKDDENGEPFWESNVSASRLYLRYPRRESNEVYIQSTEEDPQKRFKFYHSGLENWVEDIICIENDEVSTLANFGVLWGKDQEEPKYMTCLERPITIIGQDPEKYLSLDFAFQNSHLDQGLETFLFHYKDATTWRMPYLFGNSIYNHDVSKWMKGALYPCAGLQTKNDYNFDLTKIENRCNNTSNHQDFSKTPYDYRPHIREYSKGPGAPDVPYEPIGVFHKYQSSSSSLEQGESYVSSYIKLAGTDEEGVDISEAIEIGDSVAIVSDYGEQLFFYKCTTIKDLTKGKQYNFEKTLSNKSSLSSSSKQWKLYRYKGADVATKYTTSIEKKTAKWLNENEFEVQATLKNQSAENITVESSDGIVSSSEIAPLQTTTVTKVFENPEPGTTVTVNAKSTNSDATIEKEIEVKVVYHVAASENSYSYANIGSYTSTSGGGKIIRSSPAVTFYANKTDMNGFVVGEDKKPAVDDHVICNGKEVRVGSVNWSNSYFYCKLYPLNGSDSEWYNSFSDGFGGETNWIEFL